jgi:hypothetical protein
MPNRVAIVTTTIFPLDFLPVYTEDILRNGRGEQVTIYIAGDNKSDPGSEAATEVARAQGVDARFLTLDWQRDFLHRFPEVAAIIPENSDNRRNVAFLAALADGADVVISIDDDNYCLPGGDFVGTHLVVGTEATHPEAVGADGWFNLCAALETEQACGLYPRGFPFGRRRPGTDLVAGPTSGKVAANAGLWLGDPDCDAVGRLQDRPKVTGWSGEPVLLGRGVRCPINTQNTALTREAMAAYYYVRMGAQLRGLRLDRFGDILSGYFLQVCVDAMGERLRIGTPLVDHRRNPHDLLVDLYHELAGMMMVEELGELFSTVQLPSTSYADAYVALSEEIEQRTDVSRETRRRRSTRASSDRLRQGTRASRPSR